MPHTKYHSFLPSIVALFDIDDIYSPSASGLNQFSLNSNHSSFKLYDLSTFMIDIVLFIVFIHLKLLPVKLYHNMW